MFPIPAVDRVQDKVEEVEIPQKHIEALERINAITVMDRLTYNMHNQSKNAEVCGIYLCMRCVYIFRCILILFRVSIPLLSEAAAEGTKRMSMKCYTKRTLR